MRARARETHNEHSSAATHFPLSSSQPSLDGARSNPYAAKRLLSLHLVFLFLFPHPTVHVPVGIHKGSGVSRSLLLASLFRAHVDGTRFSTHRHNGPHSVRWRISATARRNWAERGIAVRHLSLVLVIGVRKCRKSENEASRLETICRMGYTTGQNLRGCSVQMRR